MEYTYLPQAFHQQVDEFATFRFPIMAGTPAPHARGFSFLLSVPSRNYLDVISIRSLTLTSKSFPFPPFVTILSFDTMAL